jgi:hypothetical protein
MKDPQRGGQLAGLDAFMESLGQLESGGDWNAVGPYTGSTYGRARGKFQVMEKIYPSWAREAGVNPNDFSPAAQERVARYKMSQYYNQFGSWDLVAVAWFAGPGRAAEAKKRGINAVGGIKDMLGTSVATYVKKVRDGMGEGGGGGAGLAGAWQQIADAAKPPAPKPAAGLPQGWQNLTQDVGQTVNRALSPMAGGVAPLSQGARTIGAIEAAPGTVLTEGQEQARSDQIGQDSLGAIMATISEAAKGSGGRILDAKSLFGMPSPEASIVEGIPDPTTTVEAPQPANPTQADAADAKLAPPPEHDGFAPLKDNAKAGAQRLMGQFPGLRFTSGYRDEKRNAAAGGVKNSKHLTGEATDFVGSEEEMQAAAAAAKAQGAKVLIHDSGSGRHLHIEWA